MLFALFVLFRVGRLLRIGGSDSRVRLRIGYPVDNLIQFAPIQPYPPALGAIVYLDALAFGHLELRSIYWAFHMNSGVILLQKLVYHSFELGYRVRSGDEFVVSGLVIYDERSGSSLNSVLPTFRSFGVESGNGGFRIETGLELLHIETEFLSEGHERVFGKPGSVSAVGPSENGLVVGSVFFRSADLSGTERRYRFDFSVLVRNSAEVLEYGIYLVPVFLMDFLDGPFLELADTERTFEVAVFDKGDFRVFVSFDVRVLPDGGEFVLGEFLGFGRSRGSSCGLRTRGRSFIYELSDLRKLLFELETLRLRDQFVILLASVLRVLEREVSVQDVFRSLFRKEIRRSYARYHGDEKEGNDQRFRMVRLLILNEAFFVFLVWAFHKWFLVER